LRSEMTVRAMLTSSLACRQRTSVTRLRERKRRAKTEMRSRLVRQFALAIATLIVMPVFAQTERTQPSALETLPTLPSALPTLSLNPHPSYSASEPFRFSDEPNPKTNVPGSSPDGLSEDEAKQRIEAKGYLNVSNLEKDSRGIWRGKATLEDGRPVDVTLDLEGNIFSTLSQLHIRIEPPRSN